MVVLNSFCNSLFLRSNALRSPLYHGRKLVLPLENLGVKTIMPMEIKGQDLRKIMKYECEIITENFNVSFKK